MEKKIELLPVDYEPKRQNMFYVEFPEEIGIEPWMVRSCDKPKYINGKWEYINMNLLDVIGPSTSQLVYNNIILKKIRVADSHLFTFQIFGIDPVGKAFEKWTIFVESVDVNFGFLEYNPKETLKILPQTQKYYYDNDNPLSIINLFIKPLKCELNYCI